MSSSTKYLVSQGFDNVKKHGSKSWTTLLIICATMLVLGLFILVYQNVTHTIMTIRQEQGLKAFIEDKITNTETIQQMEDKVTKIAGVKSVQYMDKEEAFEDAKEVLKDQAYLLDGLEKLEIFPASFIVKFESLETSSQVMEALKKVEGIYKVQYNESTISALISISNVANYLLLGIGGVMLIVCVFIISNTIKLAVYSNKREVFIMRYIGATNKFITMPFIIEGAILGLLGAIISWTIISLSYIILYTQLPQFASSIGLFGFLPYSSLWWQVLVVYLGIGLLIGVGGSIIAVKKYLKA